MSLALTPEELKDFVQTTADFLNVKYFDGVLKYTVVVSKAHSNKWYARYQYIIGLNSKENNKIILNSAMGNATIAEMEAIVAHELVHCGQHHLGYKTDHGKTFRFVARTFGIPADSARRCTNPETVRMIATMRVGGKLKP